MKLLCTADWHFRWDTPECRIDDFYQTQINTIEEIYQLKEKYNCDYVVVAGDLFDRARPDHAQELEGFYTKLFAKRKNATIIIPGNHDLLYKRPENVFNSSIGVLYPLGCLHPDIQLLSYGEEIDDYYDQDKNNKIIVMHKFCTEVTLPPWMDNGVTAKYLLDNYNYDAFIIGDNHHGFIMEGYDRLVINPGAITRQEADKKDYKPFVVILDTETMKYEKVFLQSDTSPNSVVDSHILLRKAREGRIGSFTEKIKEVNNNTLSFEKLLDEHIIVNKIRPGVVEKIEKSLRS